MPLNKYRQLIEKINIYNWRIEYDVSIKNQTWFGVGGNIDAVFKPQNQDQLQDFLKNIPVDMKILPIGATSNLLINDPLAFGVKNIYTAIDLDGGVSTGMRINFENNPFDFSEIRYVKTFVFFN